MGEVFTAASHNDVLKLLIEIVVLLFTARLFGEIAQRFGQSSVIGEILAGIVLGPSLLSGLIPLVNEWLVPQTNVQGYLLEDISLLGIIFLLLITGLETDLSLIRQQARSAIGVAVGGLSVTLSVGFLLGQLLPDDLLVNPDDRLVFSLFLAIAMAISAIPVVAKVLMDLGLTRRDVGQNIIASAMIDDTIGWILLSVVIGLAGGQAVTLGSVAESVLSVLAFLVLSFTVGQWVIERSYSFVQNNVQSRDKTLTLVVLLAFSWGLITHALHLEALLGAFVMGILFSRMPGLDPDVIHKLESIALGIFAPIFFAVAGLKVNIVTLLEPRLILITVVVTVVAMVCKVGGVYLGARLIGGRDHWSALFLGVGLNARGSMGIIVATIGLTEGVLNQETFSIVVVMAVVTSLIAPAALRWTVGNIQQGEQETARLRQEDINRDNLILNSHRVLLPVRIRPADFGNATQKVEARLLERIGNRTDMSVTLFTVATPGMEAYSDAFLSELAPMFGKHSVFKKAVQGSEPAELILKELQNGYELLVLGATQRAGSTQEALFNPIIDKLMRLAPCPTIVVHGADELPPDWTPKRVLIPTNGSQSSRRAAQVGFAISNGNDEKFIILNVVEQPQTPHIPDFTDRNTERRQTIGTQIVEEFREMGEAVGVHTTGAVRQGLATTDVILSIAEEENIDLIVIGTSVRAASENLYLGPKVERIILDAPCPVIVVNTN